MPAAPFSRIPAIDMKRLLSFFLAVTTAAAAGAQVLSV